MLPTTMLVEKEGLNIKEVQYRGCVLRMFRMTTRQLLRNRLQAQIAPPVPPALLIPRNRKPWPEHQKKTEATIAIVIRSNDFVLSDQCRLLRGEFCSSSSECIGSKAARVRRYLNGILFPVENTIDY